MFVLQLNPVNARAEAIRQVARAETREELESLIEQCTVEPYTEGRFRLCFRQGSPLQYFNPPNGDGSVSWGTPAIVDVGTEDAWVEKARLDYQNKVLSLPAANSILKE